MLPGEQRFKIYQQIAHMRVVGTPQKQIADVLGVDESRISQIVAEDKYKEVEAQIGADIIDQNKSFNNGWDGLEAAAIDNLGKTVKYNQDPELNLKIAVFANKARRRSLGSEGHAPAIPGSSNMRASVALPSAFVQLIQQNGGVIQMVQQTPDVAGSVPKQKFDTMAPGRVEAMFSGMRKEASLLGDALEGVDVAEAMKGL